LAAKTKIVKQMKVSGFTFIKNAQKFDYPVVEAITSILPICDEFVVLAGDSEDNTKELIESIGSDKIKIYDSVWDHSLRTGGRLLAVETDKAKKLIDKKSDWAFYIQADEVLHEQYHESVFKAMHEHLLNDRVEGLLFDYSHFYGSYDFVGDSRRWYPKEVRIIRNDPEIYSFRDAQGFQKNGKPLKVKHTGATMFHYGWVKPPEKQQAKQKNFHSLWHNDNWVNENVASVEKFDYSNIDSLSKFKGSHPAVMQSRVKKLNWEFDFDPSKKKLSLKHRFLHFIAKYTGWDIGRYKNYQLIK